MNKINKGRVVIGQCGSKHPAWKGKWTDEFKKSYQDKYNKEYLSKAKKDIFDLLGYKCSLCGFSDIRALQIDHINGGGSKELGNNPSRVKYYRFVVQSILNRENKYQLICANCNWIKKHINKEY